MDTSSTPAKQPHLALEADASTIGLGDTTHVRVFVVDTLGNRQLTPATLVASDTSRLATDASGNVIGRRDGVATVVASVGKLRDSIAITVRGFYVNIDTVSMFVGGQRVVAAKRYYANSEPNRGTPQATWTTSDASVASIVAGADGSIHMKAIRPGHATVTASFLNARATGEVFVDAAPTLRFTSVDAGYQNACALTVEGVVYCWGGNSTGALGTTRRMDRCERILYNGGKPNLFVRTTLQCARIPVPIETSERFSMAKLGDYHGCALNGSGSAYCWGNNGYGQIRPGLPSFVPLPPTLIPELHFKSIVPGESQTCGMTADNSLYCWGDNWAGALGTGDTINSVVPRPVVGGRAWSDVAVGFAHTCGVTTDGAVYCWGRNVNDELGRVVGQCNRGLDCSTTPILVNLPEPMASVTAGAFYTCALARTGTAYCWGSTSYVGRGIVGGFGSAPGPVATTVRFVQLSAAENETCGLTAAGEVYCWTFSPPVRNAVVTVPMRSISIGPLAACGVGKDDFVYCWGPAADGALADDSNVVGASRLVRIAGQP